MNRSLVIKINVFKVLNRLGRYLRVLIYRVASVVVVFRAVLNCVRSQTLNFK